jgi:hypothetical protein
VGSGIDSVLSVDESGYVEFVRFSDPSPTSHSIIRSASAVSDGEWHMVGLSYHYAANESSARVGDISIWIDGWVDASKVLTQQIMAVDFPSKNFVTIGYYSQPPAQANMTMNGPISLARIFWQPQALRSKYVTQQYEIGSPSDVQLGSGGDLMAALVAYKPISIHGKKTPTAVLGGAEMEYEHLHTNILQHNFFKTEASAQRAERETTDDTHVLNWLK